MKSQTYFFLSTWHHKRGFRDERTSSLVIHKKYCSYCLISNTHTTRGWQLGDMHDFYLELSVNSIDSEHWSQFTCEDEILRWDHMLTVFSRPHVALHTYRVWQATANNTVIVLCTDLYLSVRNFIPVWSSKYL